MKAETKSYETNGLRNIVQSDLRHREREALAEGNSRRLELARRELRKLEADPRD
jgi:hypothetical protein